ncbi:MAG: helix-turn-helix domain-containing protein [Candidatus Bathyarchaeota archaeon]|nr:helix-turn-helix domain-containing protein [Candidatus Bathyarchaeum sp.]
MTLQINQQQICLALNNPLRCWIIELLQSHSALSSTDLASLLHISLGKCHYHLDNLDGLIKQDNEKRYFLTEEGKRAFQLLIKL